MVRGAIIGLFCVWFFSLQGIAQQYNFKRYSVEEGLPRSGVYCMLEDSHGFLWIGTEGGGLAQFDGKEFRVYTTNDGLADNTVRCMFQDSDGNLWFGTNGQGLCKFDGRKFTTYSTANGLSNNYIRSITQGADGDLWLGTFGGGINRVKFENDSLNVTVYDKEGPLKHDQVRAALRTSDGTLWFGTDAGLCSTDGESWQHYNVADGLSHKRILVLYEDALNNLWVGTQSGVNTKTESGFESYSTEDGLIHDRIRGIVQDDLGNMWFGTQNGVTRFDGMNFVSFTEQNGLSNDRIRYMLNDRSGNLWFGTFFGGICRFSGNEFIHFTEADGLTNNQVLSIHNNYDGDVWLGTLEGITELKPQTDGTWKIEQNPLGSTFADRSINTVVGGPDNTIWFGTDNGILIKKDKQVSALKTDGSILTENVKVIRFEADSAVWIGSTQGVTRYKFADGEYSFNQYHSNANINESEVSSIYQDELGRVWIGYLSSSLVVFNGTEFLVPEALKTLKNISAIQGGHGNIWIATEGSGLFKTSGVAVNLTAEDFEQITIENGLSSADLHQLIFDGQNNLWIGTASGVDEIVLDNESNIKEVHHYGVREGFIGTETNENAVCLDHSGNLWFGTIRGATRFDPMAKSLIQNQPKLHISNISLEFENVDWGTSDYSDGISGYFGLPKNLQLPYEQNSLRLEYNGIDLKSPHSVKYQWKLEGYHDDEWSNVEEKNSVTFTNLAPKTYTFHVRSVGRNGIWNEESQTFTFTVLAPFWLSWWFIALAVIVLVFIVWSIVKLNQQRHIRENKKLQRKVDERTVELRAEKERSDELLLNILPLETAEELKEKGYASVQRYEKVSVLFTDFVGFTNITEGITHEELVRSLDEHFRMFDEVMDKYGIEKIKTIGDAYMAAGGIPTRTITNPLSVVAAGLEMIARLQHLNQQKELKGETAWQLRLGIHTGSVISGVVGKNKFAFDIWGDAVNTAARMESSGEVMKVNVSGSTYELIKDYFECTPRGKIKAKNKGEIEMYFVDRLKPAFSEDETGFVANATFMALLGNESKEISSVN